MRCAQSAIYGDRGATCVSGVELMARESARAERAESGCWAGASVSDRRPATVRKILTRSCLTVNRKEGPQKDSAESTHMRSPIKHVQPALPVLSSASRRAILSTFLTAIASNALPALPATASGATGGELAVYSVASAALDQRSYRGLVLANGLRVLLASDTVSHAHCSPSHGV